ncbi:MAG: glycosyltransferase family 2 protein [Opitutales bacterium]
MSAPTPQPEKIDRLVSVAAVVENHAEQLESFVAQVHAHLKASFMDFEIVLVDQASEDDTQRVVEALLSRFSSIRYIRLSRRAHRDVAMAACFENAIGDFVVVLDVASDPPDCARELVTRSMDTGTDVILGQSQSPVGTLPYRLARPFLAFWLQRLLRCRIHPRTTDLACMSRRAINAITETTRYHHTFAFRISRVGFPAGYFAYQPQGNRLAQHPGLLAGLRQDVRMLVFNSTRPLRWMSGLGLAGSFLAVAFGAYSLLIRLFTDRVVEGWTSLMLIVSAQFCLMFIILAFFGEYLGRMIDERSEGPQYSVVFEKHSSVMIDENRFNVLSESTSAQPNRVQTGRDR